MSKGETVGIYAKEALVKWICNYDWDVMFTLKLRDDVTKPSALNALRYWTNVIDKAYYGSRAYRNNHRFQRALFYQEGAFGDNIHFHGLAKSPNADVITFRDVLKDVWERKVVQSNTRGRFEIPRNKYAISDYFTKEWWKLGQDTFEVFNTHLKPLEYVCTKDDARDVRRRLRQYRRA